MLIAIDTSSIATMAPMAAPLPFLSAREIAERVDAMAEAVARDHPSSPADDPLWLVGALKGAVFLLADLARAVSARTDRPIVVDFVRTSSYGAGTRSTGEVRFVQDVEGEIAAADVVIVEDIVDSGHTARMLLDHFAARKARSVRLAALLSKPDRREVEVGVDYLGFEIPDRFVVGYGMDYAEQYRHLPDIRVLDL